MARKKRDYKAEYARRKIRSKTLGYRNPREEYLSRKSLGLSREFKSLPKRELPDFVTDILTGRASRNKHLEAQRWSDAHSNIRASKYRGNMSNAQFDAYYRAFVEDYQKLGSSRRKRAIERRRRIHEYMRLYGGVEEGTPEDARYLVGLRT